MVSPHKDEEDEKVEKDGVGEHEKTGQLVGHHELKKS